MNIKKLQLVVLLKVVLFAFVVIGLLAVGYWMMTLDSDDNIERIEPLYKLNVDETETIKQTSEISPTNNKVAINESSAGSHQTITNSIGMEFVLIPAGEFYMGSPLSEKDRDINEGPVHHITIAKEFYLGKYEVTQEQWREIMGDNPSWFEGENLPVEQVSLEDVQEFIEKLNQKEGADTYRLPSEAEWEYAARAGTTTEYWFNKSNIDDYAWYDNSDSGPHPIGLKKPNPWGLYDMQGNVWEWLQDRYHVNYEGAPTDGTAWLSGSNSNQVVRGGDWHGRAEYCRSALRGIHNPRDRYYRIGFRLLQEV